MDEIVLFVSTTTEADFHVALPDSKSISRLVSSVHSDISSLMGEAEGVETRSRKSRKVRIVYHRMNSSANWVMK